MKSQILILFILISFSISSQTLDRKILLKNKVREIKSFTSENKELQSLISQYFINDSGLVNKTIDFSIKDDKLDSLFITNCTYDLLNRKKSEVRTFRGESYSSEFFYPDSNTVIIKYTKDGKPSEDILKSHKRGKHLISKGYHNGKLTITLIHTKKENITTTTQHDKHPRHVSKMTSYYDAQNNHTKTVGTSKGRNPNLSKKFTRTMIYDSDNTLIKKCSVDEKSDTPSCTYYEYIK